MLNLGFLVVPPKLFDLGTMSEPSQLHLAMISQDREEALLSPNLAIAPGDLDILVNNF